MANDQSQIEQIVLQVLKQMQQDKSAVFSGQVEATFQVCDGAPAAVGTNSKEVVVGLGAAFAKTMSETINGLSHEQVLAEVMAGIEEEGMEARIVRIMRTSDVGFIAHDAAKLSGSGVGIGIQSKGTTVIHQRDLPPLSNLELFPLAPLLKEKEYRAIGRNAAKYAKGDSPSPVFVQLDQSVLPIYQPKAVLMHNKETQLVVERGEPLTVQL